MADLARLRKDLAATTASRMTTSTPVAKSKSRRKDPEIEKVSSLKEMLEAVG